MWKLARGFKIPKVSPDGAAVASTSVAAKDAASGAEI
jgi:hypothetical protein